MGDMLNPRQVEAFEAVVRSGTTTAAAQLLHISQPAVSRLIRDFERAVSLKLFQRNGNRLTPTPDALVLVREAQRCFDSFRHLVECAEQIRSGFAGGLRIAAMPALALKYLSATIADLLEIHPGLSVTVHCEVSQNLPPLIASGQFDIGIGSLPIHGPAVRLEPLPVLRAACALPPKHPLTREKVVELRALRRVPMLSYGGNSLLRTRVQMAMACLGIQPRVRVESNTGATLCGLVQRGLGVAVVDPFTALECIALGIPVRPLSPEIPYEATVMFPNQGVRPAAADAFMAAFKRQICKDFKIKWN